MCYARAVPRFEPFPGLRYDPAIPLDEVIAPPYDVVTPSERAMLAARSSANAIHVELPEPDPDLGLDRYANARRIFDGWLRQGVVRREEGPAFYAYRMVPPAAPPTIGVIGALACEEPGGDILPHEQTIPKDASDRLDLLRACQANLSPIWGLSLTDGLTTLFEPDTAPHAQATDDQGTHHQLWVVDDRPTIEAITKAVGANPVVIADGHHRYETALAYRAERRAARGGSGGDYDLVMALVVELSEDQLRVGPIHRTVHGVAPGTDLPTAMSRWFELERLGPYDRGVVASLSAAQERALVTAAGVWRLTPRPEALEAAGSDLDASVVALAVDALSGAVTRHHHGWEEAVAGVESGTADAAILVRPVTVDQIGHWARARRRMPPKSTYFTPKPRTGMVYRMVRD